jgi:hypothetical protein
LGRRSLGGFGIGGFKTNSRMIFSLSIFEGRPPFLILKKKRRGNHVNQRKLFIYTSCLFMVNQNNKSIKTTNQNNKSKQ